MSAKELIEEAVQHLHTTATVKTVYGEPIHAEGKTVVPVAKVAYGFGGGSGTGKPRPNGEGKAPATGEGAGGGVAAKPVGVVEITGAETKFVQFGAPRKLALTALIGSALGVAFGWLLGRKSSRS
jgi:uncharacterized spore protein YtfJ